MSQLEPIPALSAFPPYSPEKRRALQDSIAEFGQVKPAVRSGRFLIDGREREIACEALGIACRYVELEDVAKEMRMPVLDPFVACVLLNRERRHQDDGSLLITAAQLAKLGRGRPSKNRQLADLSISEAAELVGTPKRNAERMRVVLKRGAPELVEAVRRNEVPVSTAEEFTKHEPARQVELLKASKGQPRGVQRALARMKKEQMQCSHALRLSPADVVALQALAAYGKASTDAKVRAGVLVLKRIAPASRPAVPEKR